jgi:hypothetical protein
MRATALMLAGEAELALVGVPKSDGLGSLGAVSAAAELYRKAAQAVGEATPVGEQAKKRADELEANKEEIERVGVDLYDRPLGIPTPGGPAPGGPKAPEGPLPTTQPAGPTPDAPKAPDKPLTSPPAAAAGVIGGVATPPSPPDPNKK